MTLQQSALRFVYESVQWHGFAGEIDFHLTEQLGLEFAVGLNVDADGGYLGNGRGIRATPPLPPLRTATAGVVGNRVIDLGVVRRGGAEAQARGDGAVPYDDSVHSQQHHGGESLQAVAGNAFARHGQQILLDHVRRQFLAR